MVQTNYDLCNYLNQFIDQRVTDKIEKRKHKTKYFAIYVFLLYKIYNFKMDYCKDIINIFCTRFISYSLSVYTPDQVFQDITYAIVQFDSAFDACMPKRVRKPYKEALLQEALAAVSDTFLKLTKSEGNTVKGEKIVGDIVSFIGSFSSVWEDIQKRQ